MDKITAKLFLEKLPVLDLTWSAEMQADWWKWYTQLAAILLNEEPPAQPAPQPIPKDLMEEYKKLADRAKLKERPFYPPPPPMELAPSWPIARPMCGTGESVPDLGHSTIP